MTRPAPRLSAAVSQTEEHINMGSVGLIADTHDELNFIDLAVDLFGAEGCHAIVHAGDIESPAALRRFAPLTASGANLFWILGEHDSDEVALTTASHDVRAIRLDSATKVSIDGLSLAAIHNPYGGKGKTRPFLLERLCDPSSGCDVVVYGHFHYFNIKYPSAIAPAAVVCPGGCRRDVRPQTVAILETNSRELRVFALDLAAGRADLAFSTALVPGGQCRLTAGKGLTERFRRAVLENLQDPRRDYWRINDRWGAPWVADWLDPTRILALDGAG